MKAKYRIACAVLAAAMLVPSAVMAADDYSYSKDANTVTNVDASGKTTVLIVRLDSEDDTDIAESDIVYVDQSDSALGTLVDFMIKAEPATGLYRITLGGDSNPVSGYFTINNDLQVLVDEATVGEAVDIIGETVDGKGDTAAVNAGSTVTVSAATTVKNATITAKGSGTIQVEINKSVEGQIVTSTITAKSVQFDGTGKVIPSEGAVISTPNGKDGETDNGYFVMKEVKAGATEVEFKIGKNTMTGKLETEITSDTNVLFGIFITGVPSTAGEITVE